jgi:hypothetical protein
MGWGGIERRGKRKEERTSISKVYSDTPTVLRRARRTSSAGGGVSVGKGERGRRGKEGNEGRGEAESE